MNLLQSLVLAVLLPTSAVRAAVSPDSAHAPVRLAARAAGTAGSAEIRFTYENPQLEPSKYVLVAEENGSGHYSSHVGAATSTARVAADPETDQSPVVSQDRAIQISRATNDAIFSAARKSQYFMASCDAQMPHIAFQGKKTLEYSGPRGKGSCTYNWSNSKQIQYLASTFEAIAFTLEEGAKLTVEYEHSRLRLDPELELLAEQVQNGDALELNNIAPILMKIAGDDAVLKRAQRRARDLLAIARSK